MFPITIVVVLHLVFIAVAFVLLCCQYDRNTLEVYLYVLKISTKITVTIVGPFLSPNYRNMIMLSYKDRKTLCCFANTGGFSNFNFIKLAYLF